MEGNIVKTNLSELSFANAVLNNMHLAGQMVQMAYL